MRLWKHFGTTTRPLGSPFGGAGAAKPRLRGSLQIRNMSTDKNNKMLPLARELRRDMTPQERKLWYLFLRKYPVKVYKQRIIDSFIVDFYCASAKLVIELDGSQHYSDQGQAYDTERSAILSKYGLEILRFSNSEINTQFEAVCNLIDSTIQKRLLR